MSLENMIDEMHSRYIEEDNLKKSIEKYIVMALELRELYRTDKHSPFTDEDIDRGIYLALIDELEKLNSNNSIR
jgi:hypothetical protein